MKSNFPKIIFAIILSSFLYVSCGEEKAKKEVEKVMDKITACAQSLELCEEDCGKPTQEQLDAWEECYSQCIQGYFSPPEYTFWECQNLCDQAVFGDNTEKLCKNNCKEKFYACVFGANWKDKNIKKP